MDDLEGFIPVSFFSGKKSVAVVSEDSKQEFWKGQI